VSIHFTQYLRPDGTPKDVEVDRPEEIEALAGQLIEMGCWFDIEVLNNGVVSMTCEIDDGDQSEPIILAHQLVLNGPSVLDSVDDLIRTAVERTGADVAG
jgi:hypothetical protein